MSKRNILSRSRGYGLSAESRFIPKAVVLAGAILIGGAVPATTATAALSH